jgi:hypothetical protein
MRRTANLPPASAATLAVSLALALAAAAGGRWGRPNPPMT